LDLYRDRCYWSNIIFIDNRTTYTWETYKKEKHKTIIDKKIHAKGKHRYFYFNGDKKFKRDMLKKLKDRWTIQDYPKGENERYKIIDNIPKQQTLI